ncbi:MAG: cbb3-type cytochrome c oxidase subunit I [Methylococcales bacterium]|nr:cbb3-type cytochrome c oxidase subunit I [Methylococcales bacterium]
MLVAGMPDVTRRVFMVSTLFVAIPTGIKFFSWIATVWGGKIIFPTPMLFVLGAISVFLIGGLTGPILATVPTNMHLHDSYWIVGHFHATIFGGFVFPFFAAVYYWYPKATGKMYDERLGKMHFWLMTPGFWLMSIGQMSVGLLGMTRRYADYEESLNISTVQTLVTFSAFIIGWSVLIMCYNLIYSATRTDAVPAGNNPWGSRSPEWQVASPLPEMNFDYPIEIIGEPYDFGRGDYVKILTSGD